MNQELYAQHLLELRGEAITTELEQTIQNLLNSWEAFQNTYENLENDIDNRFEEQANDLSTTISDFLDLLQQEHELNIQEWQEFKDKIIKEMNAITGKYDGKTTALIIELKALRAMQDEALQAFEGRIKSLEADRLELQSWEKIRDTLNGKYGSFSKDIQDKIDALEDKFESAQQGFYNDKVKDLKKMVAVLKDELETKDREIKNSQILVNQNAMAIQELQSKLASSNNTSTLITFGTKANAVLQLSGLLSGYKNKPFTGEIANKCWETINKYKIALQDESINLEDSLIVTYMESVRALFVSLIGTTDEWDENLKDIVSL